MFDYMVLRWIGWHNWREEKMKDKILIFSSKLGIIDPGWVDGCWRSDGTVDEKKLDETFRNHANCGANATRELPYYGKNLKYCTPFVKVGSKHDLSKKNESYFDGIKLHLHYAKKYNLMYWQSILDGNAVDKSNLNKYNPIVTNVQGIKIWDRSGWKYIHNEIDWFIRAGVKNFELGNEIGLLYDDYPKIIDCAVDMYLYLIEKGIGQRNINMGFQHSSEAWNQFKRKLWDKTKPYDSKTDMFSSVHQVIKNKYVPRIIEGKYITRRFFLSTDGDKPRPDKEKVYDYFFPLFDEIEDGKLQHIHRNDWGFEVLNHSKDKVEDNCKGLAELHEYAFGKYPENYGKFPKPEEPEPHSDIPYSDTPHSDSPPTVDPDPPSFWERLWEWIKGIFGG
jgi:hypothetical protein